MSCLTEGRLASVALVWLLAGVDAPMVPEGCVAGESFITNLTDVRFLTTVSSFVVLQVRRLRKLHATGATFVRFLSRVDSSMILEINRLGKGYPTHVTFVVFLARMQLLVRPQAGIPRKPSTAGIARKRLLLRLLLLNGHVGRVYVVLLFWVTADDNHTGSVALGAFGDRRQVTLLDRMGRLRRHLRHR